MGRRFRRALEHAQTVQQHTLLEKVRRNASSRYGRERSFAAIRSVDDFRRALPISTYADVEPYIDQVRSGDVAALFGPRQKLHMFAMTSGTAGRPKYIPVTDSFLKEYRRGWMTWGIHAYLRYPEALQGSILQLVSAIDDEYSPSGLPCGAISGLTAQMQRGALHRVYVLPGEVVRLKDTATKYYVALRLALGRNVLVVASANPSTLLGLSRALDERSEELIRDVRDGGLSTSVDVPGEVRRAIEARVRPDPRRANRLAAARTAAGALRPRDVWRQPFIGCWKGGTLSLYLREFPRYFGDVPVRDIGLVASEGRMTIPLTDDGSSGVLDIESQFFEFLPACGGVRDGDRTLLPHELQVGGEYFLILTNSAGLYRYDIGDVVRVTGFIGPSPLVEFLNKGAHYASLTGEKLSEHQVVEAVNRALAETGGELASYCLAARWNETVPHYVLMVERQNADGMAFGGRLAGRVDELLRELNIEYNAKRTSGRLGPIAIKAIPDGSWREYDLRTIVERRRGMEQYKHKFLVGDVEFERGFPDVK
jgi:hypothetical protein